MGKRCWPSVPSFLQDGINTTTLPPDGHCEKKSLMTMKCFENTMRGGTGKQNIQRSLFHPSLQSWLSDSKSQSPYTKSKVFWLWWPCIEGSRWKFQCLLCSLTSPGTSSCHWKLSSGLGYHWIPESFQPMSSLGLQIICFSALSVFFLFVPFLFC